MAQEANEVVIVAGIDYPKYEESKSSKREWKLVHGKPNSMAGKLRDWRGCGLRLGNLLAQKYKNLTVTLFDFGAGTRETWSAIRTKQLQAGPKHIIGKPDYANYRIVARDASKAWRFTPVQDTWPRVARDPPQIIYVPGISDFARESVSAADVRDQWLKLAPSKSGSLLGDSSISMVHVYEYLRRLGAGMIDQKPGTVRELHVLSHAWAEGPILLNTLDWGADNRFGILDTEHLHLRDPLDRDGRGPKDFHPDNTSAAQLESFQMAFHPNAVGYIWGCHQAPFLKELIRSTTKQMSPTAPEEGKLLTFEYDDYWGDRDVFERKLKMPDKNRPKPLRLADVRTLVQEQLDNSYAQTLATAMERTVIGPIPAASADPDRKGPVEKRLWSIPLGALSGYDENDAIREYPENWKRWLRFYRDQLKMEIDQDYSFGVDAYGTEFGRGCLKFKPKPSS